MAQNTHITEDWLDFDREHLWHPYTSMRDPLPVVPVASASGVRLRLTDGRQLIDGMSSWWAAIHGYNCPELNQALIDQAHKMSHVMFGGITHRPAVSLARLLLTKAPKGLEKVFFHVIAQPEASAKSRTAFGVGALIICSRNALSAGTG